MLFSLALTTFLLHKNLTKLFITGHCYIVVELNEVFRLGWENTIRRIPSR